MVSVTLTERAAATIDADEPSHRQCCPLGNVDCRCAGHRHRGGALRLNPLISTTELPESTLSGVIWANRRLARRLVVVAFFIWGNGTAVAIGLAITRHDVYEIDRIISRTATYGVLTALVVAVYRGAVSLLRTLPRDSSQWQAQRSRRQRSSIRSSGKIQSAVDRRFNCASYDRQLTLARLGQEMTNEVDLDSVAGQLEKVAGATMQPDKLSVWVR